MSQQPTFRLIVRAAAEGDITDAAMAYERQAVALGHAFLAEVDLAIESAVAHPRQYPRLRRQPEVRRVLLRRFPYRVFFILRADAVIVFRVLHGARHDREWKQVTPEV